MTALPTIREHMQVIGADGQHVGVVDSVDNALIKLTKSDAQTDLSHHWIPIRWVSEVDDLVRLRCSAEQATQLWSAEPVAVSDEWAEAIDGLAEMKEDVFAANRAQARAGEVY
jgi:hypothetical protein